MKEQTYHEVKKKKKVLFGYLLILVFLHKFTIKLLLVLDITKSFGIQVPLNMMLFYTIVRENV